MKLTKSDLEKKKARVELLKRELYSLQTTKVDSDLTEDIGFRYNSDKALLDDQKQMVSALINSEEEDIRTAEIVDVLEIPEDVVGLDDVITVVMQFGSGAPEETVLHITDIVSYDSEYTPVTTASPIGMAVYGKKVGSTVSCKTPAGKLTIQIVSKSRGLVK